MTATIATLAFFVAASPLKKYLDSLFDKTFTVGFAGKALYQVNAFDLLLLAPYFSVLIVLATYGLHRYWLVYTYFKHRKNALGAPARRFEQLPRVTVQLPIYNERFVVERLLESVCRLQYPRELLEIQVLDDSTDETVEVARAAVDRLAAQGHPVTYIHREHRHGYKAGALEEGLRAARGEFLAIFDADFVPPPDFLMRTIHYFTDPQVGMVQARWTFLNRQYSFLTQVQALLLDGHFVLEHGARARAGCFFNFNGTAGVWRRQAILEGGGWQHDTLTEDTDLSYRAQMRGWRFLYQPDIECPSELPVEMNAFKTQQARWAKGLIQTARKLLPALWRAPLPRRVKIEAWFHLTANFSYPLMIVLSTLLLPAMIVRFYQGWFQMLYIDLPLFLAATFSISSFYLTAQRELFPNDWKRAFKYLPFLMALGIGLTVTNARAVLEALLGVASPFQRTAKYNIESGAASLQHPGWRLLPRLRPRAYRRKGGWAPVAELAIGTYFLWTVIYAVQNQNLATVPFLAIFVLGYYYTGVMSLLQGRVDGALAWLRPQPAPVAPKPVLNTSLS